MHRFSKIVIQPRVSRSVYFRFKTLAASHAVSVEKAIEELMRDALARVGVETPEHEDVKTT